MKNIIYKVEDIFHNIEGDDKNVNMTIPPEVLEALDMAPGDTVVVEVKDGQLSLTKKDK
jgi:AbrB family looped-hinge helix DNA binding protein